MVSDDNTCAQNRDHDSQHKKELEEGRGREREGGREGGREEERGREGGRGRGREGGREEVGRE